MIFFLLLHLSGFAATFTSPTVSFQYDDKIWELIKPTEKTKGEAVDAKMQGKTVVTLQRKNADEKYRARFSVVVDSLANARPAKGEAPFIAYTRYTQDFLKGQRFSILDSRKFQIGSPSMDASETTLFQRDFGLKFRQIIFVKGDEAYLITFTSRLKPFDDYLKEIDSLLATLRVTAS